MSCSPSQYPYTNPTVEDFPNRFVRDFPYGTDPNTSVLIQDIQNAYNQTIININPRFFDNQAAYTQGFLFLAAHYLVIDIRMSTQGLSGQYNFLENSKSVGSLSQSTSIPQRILDNPYLAMLTKTNYGAKYLELILPQFCGQMFSARGYTHP
jgi:hypothetical protein